MPSGISLLQLDTKFPRIPGDIGNPETFLCHLEIHKIKAASVGAIVTSAPEKIEMKPFKEAIRNSKADVIATSCGFLSYWQDELQKNTEYDFVSSSLIDLPSIAKRYAPNELLILTFDAQKLGPSHFPKGYEPYLESVVGLEPEMHLRAVIEQDKRTLDAETAQHQVSALLHTQIKPKKHRAILLECTNLPPYKAKLKAEFGLPIFDILTSIETRARGHSGFP